MLCQDVMSTKVYSCSERDTLSRCAHVMKDYNIGFVPVVADNGRLIGVVTDRDIAVRAVAASKPPTTRVSDVMSKPVLRCLPQDPVDEAERKMAEHKKSRMPVVNDHGVCVGIISLADVARMDADRSIESLYRSVTAREARDNVLMTA